MVQFGLVGVGGFVAPRHLKAIKDTGNTLLAALDPNDSVGVLDSYFPDARFFTEVERFDRFLEKRRREGEQIDYISICSPNYLHDAHIRMALRVRANAICEKPLVINPWNLDALAEIEAEYDRHIYTILQLRLHPALIALRERINQSPTNTRYDVALTYATQRGPWYDISWKGDEEKSGGVAMNIGIHFFDLCIWLFGTAHDQTVFLREPRRMSGVLELERATVRWFLSVDANDLPEATRAAGKRAYRSLTIDDEEIEFSEGFTDLHTRVYEEVFAGRGFRLNDARPSIDVVHAMRSGEVVSPDKSRAHPYLIR